MRHAVSFQLHQEVDLTGAMMKCKHLFDESTRTQVSFYCKSVNKWRTTSGPQRLGQWPSKPNRKVEKMHVSLLAGWRTKILTDEIEQRQHPQLADWRTS